MAGTSEVGLLSRVTLQNGEDVDLWTARDAVVMKALALVLPRSLPLSTRCTHLNGHGGLKYAVREVIAALPEHRFVLKTDVRSYYASIDHRLLLDRLAVYITDQQVLNLIGQYLRRCAERGGLVWDHTQGIALGSPLSPILGAFFLTEVDDALERLGLFYVRYMDDILVLAPTRWKLRQAVKVVNEGFTSLRLAKHPDKTFIGRLARGFDFLGYHFSPDGLCVTTKTLQNLVARVHQLYEREREKPEGSSTLGAYVRRWVRWVSAGLSPAPQRQRPVLRAADP
jgi:RNA-directed DNA polymerase